MEDALAVYILDAEVQVIVGMRRAARYPAVPRGYP
jgi:hypothetical protein